MPQFRVRSGPAALKALHECAACPPRSRRSGADVALLNTKDCASPVGTHTAGLADNQVTGGNVPFPAWAAASASRQTAPVRPEPCDRPVTGDMRARSQAPDPVAPMPCIEIGFGCQNLRRLLQVDIGRGFDFLTIQRCPLSPGGSIKQIRASANRLQRPSLCLHLRWRSSAPMCAHPRQSCACRRSDR